jgi:hypothetical protein
MAYQAGRLVVGNTPSGSAGGFASDSTVESTQRELEAIERAFNLQDFVQLKQINAPPEKPRDGLVVYADGTNWNPGAGEGIYAFFATVWNKL